MASVDNLSLRYRELLYKLYAVRNSFNQEDFIEYLDQMVLGVAAPLTNEINELTVLLKELDKENQKLKEGINSIVNSYCTGGHALCHQDLPKLAALVDRDLPDLRLVDSLDFIAGCVEYRKSLDKYGSVDNPDMVDYGRLLEKVESIRRKSYLAERKRLRESDKLDIRLSDSFIESLSSQYALMEVCKYLIELIQKGALPIKERIKEFNDE